MNKKKAKTRKNGVDMPIARTKLGNLNIDSGKMTCDVKKLSQK